MSERNGRPGHGRVEREVPQRRTVQPHLPGQRCGHGDTDQPGRRLVEVDDPDVAFDDQR